MFSREPRDLIQTLGEMARFATHRANANQGEAKKLFQEYLSNDKRFKPYDAQRLTDKVWQCRSNGGRLDLDDPWLHGGGLAAGGESGDEMRAIICSALMALTMLTITTAGAQAQRCTRNHELYRIVPEYRAIMLDGGNIKRVMFVDWHDERLKTWKPGHNITFCPDENKMINTTINSVVTLNSESLTSCKTHLVSDLIDRDLQEAWDHTNKHLDPGLFVTAAKSELGWYYVVCTDHDENWFKNEEFRDFLNVAASLTKIDMAVDDPVNESTYKARAAQYEKWRDALYAAEGKKSLVRRIWERLTH
jgi:hypothetical protein